jgi:long-subunit fatty acid transport protein
MAAAFIHGKRWPSWMMARNEFAPSYKLGALYEPYDWLGFGIVYQSEIKAKMHGTYEDRIWR